MIKPTYKLVTSFDLNFIEALLIGAVVSLVVAGILYVVYKRIILYIIFGNK